ncbi:MAG: GNAT family N-acetyltransferase [Muribaculaceae bacterium]
MYLRKAHIEDMEDVMRVFSQARLAQRRAGFRQWEDGYPSIDVLKSDIDRAIGFILDDNGKTAGYIAIAAYDDEYNRHPELWDVGKDYAVFHRIALSDDYRGKKLSGILFDLAESHALRTGAAFVRIDTGLENKPMQHILSKRGYINLGRCDFIWGERLAYEKPLP